MTAPSNGLQPSLRPSALLQPSADAEPLSTTQAWSGTSTGGRRVVARTHIGLVRRRLEDAWRVALDVPFLGGRVDAFAVFDGLGGHPNGREAAWAAARSLPQAIAAATDASQVLPLLDAPVAATGGLTTAAVALLPTSATGGTGHLLGAGDSSTYAVQDGQVSLLIRRDRAGRSTVTDFLGRGSVRGQVRRWDGRQRLLLCTDGVDDVVGTEALRAALEAPPGGLEEALDRLMQGVLRAGAPDNATVLALG